MEAFMKDQSSYSKDNSYQATNVNKTDNNLRNPNAPTQGGYSTPGTGSSGPYPKDKNQTPANKQQPSNQWGTGSINKKDKPSDKDSHR
jgi:hypothetical protein